jgi:hypothetical protein
VTGESSLVNVSSVQNADRAETLSQTKDPMQAVPNNSAVSDWVLVPVQALTRVLR